MVELPVYLDNHSTTRVDPRVVAAMLPCFSEVYGNPASVNHALGRAAAEAVALARAQVAAFIGAAPETIVFTSGATEANNLAIKGLLRRSPRGSHIISCATEHKSVLDPLKRLQRQGFPVTILPVDRAGRITAAQVAEALRPETVLVSIMAANNEIGTLQPVREIGEVCRSRNVTFHCDAAQALGRIPLEVRDLQADLVTFSGHKVYGPKGVGALYVTRERRISLEPLLEGGGHEGHLRSGTLAVPLIVGLGLACKLAFEELPTEMARIRGLRERLRERLWQAIPGVQLNGDPENRLPGNLHVTIDGVNGDVLMQKLTDIAVSSGAACSTAEPEPSHVLRAIGLGDLAAKNSLRFGIGRFNTEQEIDFAAAYLLEKLRHAGVPGL